MVLCVGLCHFASHTTFSQAAVEGKVTLPKAPPMEMPPARYPGQVGEIAPPDPPRAVVYLEGDFPQTNVTALRATNELRQQGLQFRPGLLSIQVGSAVSFPNDDDLYHNVFSYSKTKRFDLGRYRKFEKPQPIQVFDKPGVVKLYCEIHQHMRGVILVLDTPYFVTTETNGLYQLKDLPAGHFTLKAWVDEKHVYEKPVDLEAGKTLHVDFEGK